MSIEKKLAMLHEGSSFKAERMDGNLIYFPIEEVAGVLGMISRTIDMRRSKRNAGLSTKFGLDLLIAQGTDSNYARKSAGEQCARLAWGLFWTEPGNNQARVKKETFTNLGNVAVDDFCNPGRYHGASTTAMSRLLKVDNETFERRFSSIYGQLKTEMYRAVHPVRADFWRLLG